MQQPQRIHHLQSLPAIEASGKVLRFIPELAAAIGQNEHVILLHLDWLLQRFGRWIDGQLWVKRSVREWTADLAHLPTSTAQRALKNLQSRLLVAKRQDGLQTWWALCWDRVCKLPGIVVQNFRPAAAQECAESAQGVPYRHTDCAESVQECADMEQDCTKMAQEPPPQVYQIGTAPRYNKDEEFLPGEGREEGRETAEPSETEQPPPPARRLPTKEEISKFGMEEMKIPLSYCLLFFSEMGGRDWITGSRSGEQKDLSAPKDWQWKLRLWWGDQLNKGATANESTATATNASSTAGHAGTEVATESIASRVANRLRADYGGGYPRSAV